jgi:hypothetical protein
MHKLYIRPKLRTENANRNPFSAIFYCFRLLCTLYNFEVKLKIILVWGINQLFPETAINWYDVVRLRENIAISD